ncbi:MAG: hypothetical protein ACRYG8_14045 [Janthinobacterium lividum]
MPAEPRTIGAYLASLGDTHAPNTIRRRLLAIGKAHQYNSLAWNAGHRDIQEPLRGALREHGRPPKQAAALTLELLQRLLDTRDLSPGGRRHRAMLLIGFAPPCAAPSSSGSRSATSPPPVTGWRSGLPLENRSGRGGGINRPAAWRAPTHLSGASLTGMAAGRQTIGQPAVPADQEGLARPGEGDTGQPTDPCTDVRKGY